MPDERDQTFARDVLNASLTLMSILVAVIAVLIIEYKRVYPDQAIAGPINKAVWGTNASQELPSSALTIVPLAMRERMNERPSPAVRTTAGSDRPLRSRMITTALRLPV